MNRSLRILMTVVAGGSLLQFGGCVADILTDVFFLVGPFLL